MKQSFFVLFTVLLACSAFAAIPEDSMKIYAVTTDGQGLVATLHIKIEPGSGKIWSSVTPLVGTSTQNAEKTALRVAKNFSDKTGSYDYKFTIDSTASVVDGPSAGAAMALLVSSMLTDKDMPGNVSLTGTINEDGRVGPVGGVFEKAREAGRTGVKLFLIPKGEAIQTVKLPEGVASVNMLDYAPKNWGIKVAEVEKIEDAMRLAHSSIDEIDVNAFSANEIPEFVPEKIRLPKNLEEFKMLTTNYIAKTKLVASEARNALSSSLLEDPAVTHSMLEALNGAERTVQRAEILNEQNYLYSAANFAFLARVNAIMVKEIAVNPKLLEPFSAAFDLRLLDLRKEIESFEEDLHGNVPRENVEWLASSQQRFMYAKTTLNKLTAQQTVVVGGTKEEEASVELQRLQDYAFAVAWLDVSKDFYGLSKRSPTGYVRPIGRFRASAAQTIAAAEQSLGKIKGEEDRQDIVRRIDSAKSELDANWFEASYFDAAAAKAISDSELAAKDKNHDGLGKILEEKIVSVERKIADSNTTIGWAPLYLDHAKYFLASAKYYDERGLPTSASDNLRSGISLAFLADQLFDASAGVVETYSTQPIVAKTGGSQTNGFQANGRQSSSAQALAGGETLPYALAIIFLVVVILGLLLVIAGLIRDSRRGNGEQTAIMGVAAKPQEKPGANNAIAPREKKVSRPSKIPARKATALRDIARAVKKEKSKSRK